MIRESTSSRPEIRHTDRINRILSFLTTMGLIENENVQIPISVGGRISSIKFIKISQFDPELLSEFMGEIFPSNQANNNRPANVEQHIWDTLPSDITQRWGRFNSDLQQHIVECKKANLVSQFKHIETQRLGNTFRSPIMLNMPTIPVRLPSTNDTFDLMDILKIEQRDPRNRAARAHPLTREYFTLDKVLPAGDALEQIQKRVQSLKI